jgi:hypothetical protein
MKMKFIKIIKGFLNLTDKYNNNYKIISTALLFNWMLTNHVKSKIFINKHPKFKKVVNSKIHELGSDFRIINCKYWKGKDVYKKYLI